MKKLFGLLILTFIAGNAVHVFAEDCKVGEVRAEGYVFYCDNSSPKKLPDGKIGLEATLVDQSTSQVWSNITDASLYDNKEANNHEAIGEGQKNTDAIMTQAGHRTSAAKICKDQTIGGHTDWFLPSTQEFAQIYKTYADLPANSGVSGFGLPQHLYWTSTEYSSTEAQVQYSNYWFHNFAGKENSNYVRCARAF